MTLRIPMLNLAVKIDVRRIQYRRRRFGRPAPDPVIGAAALLSTASVLTGIAQIAGWL